MGTSRSSGGAPPRVPLVPPWVPDLPPDIPPSEPVPEPPLPEKPTDQPEIPPQKPQATDLAPLRRFARARGSLSRFVNTRSPAELRRAIGHYVRQGLGGSAVATRRFASTPATAARLYAYLSPQPAEQQRFAESAAPLQVLAGRAAREVIGQVADAIRPPDGTLDAEFNRISIRDSLSDLLNEFPDADLLHLSANELLFVIERYIAYDIFGLVRLDIGTIIQDKAPTVGIALERLRDIRDYVRQTVAAEFRKLRKLGDGIERRRIAAVVRSAVQKTLEVFEEYAK